VPQRNLYRELIRLVNRKGALIRLLDRKGGRTILGKLATWYLQRRWRLDAEVLYDGVWIHRFGDTYYVGEPRFTYLTEFPHWPEAAERLKRQTHDHWFHGFAATPGMVVLDVGAGIGTDTLFFSRAVGPAGRVIAVEAHPRTFRLLQATRRLNRLENVLPVNCAAMDKACAVYIEDYEKHEENSVSLRRTSRHLPTPVRGMTLDEICRESGVRRVDFIKMNIEGAERFAIGGMKDVIAQARFVCIACHDWRGAEGPEFCTRDAVSQFLRESGFHVTRRADDPRPYVRDQVLARRVSVQERDAVGNAWGNVGSV
jgi:FkbM family methyltransferase